MSNLENKKEQPLRQDNAAPETSQPLNKKGTSAMTDSNKTNKNHNKKASQKRSKPKAWRKFCIRHIQANRCYTPAEAAIELDRHPSYVNKHIREGKIKTLDNKKSTLIHGTDLRTYAEAVNNERKCPINPGEFFCFACQASRPAQSDSLRLEQNKQNRPVIRGKCQECGCNLHYISSDAKIEEKFEEIKTRAHGVKQLSQRTTKQGSALFRDSDVVPVYNAHNERLKYRYYDYLHHTKGFSEKSMKTIRANLLRCERLLNFADFADYDRDMGKKLKKRLKDSALSQSVVSSSLSHLKQCLLWLKEQQGYRRKLHVCDINYLSVTLQEKRALGYTRLQRYPSVEDMVETLLKMPYCTPKEKRNRAMLALIMLTGIRDGTLPHLLLKHIDLAKQTLIVDPKEVPVKGGHYYIAQFVPLPAIVLQIFEEYINMLRQQYGFTGNHPLFPKLERRISNGIFAEGDFSTEHMKDEQMIRRVVIGAFEDAIGESYSPHKIRHTLADMGKNICKSPRQLKAWSQNLGHQSTDHLMETYGQLDPETQRDIIATFRWDGRMM